MVLPGVTAAKCPCSCSDKVCLTDICLCFWPRINSSVIGQLFVDFVQVYGCSRQSWPHMTCVVVRCTYNVLFLFGEDIIVREHYGSIIGECCLLWSTQERVYWVYYWHRLNKLCPLFREELTTYRSWWKSNINSCFETYVLIRHQL